MCVETESNRLTKTAVVCMSVVAGLSFATGCQTNEATGRSQLNFMSLEEEIALGEEAMPELVDQYGGRVNDAVLNEYVSRVGHALAAHSELSNDEVPWEFILLDSEVINAFALPGGKVFISRGLMSKMTNEAQLAGVLGHEIGHVTAEHVDERISNATLLKVGTSALSVATQDAQGMSKYIPAVVGTGGQGYLLKFGRDQESEADSLGLRYMARAGYNPHAQRQVMQILESTMGEGRSPEWLSTHPYPETRVDRINDELNRIYSNAMRNPDLSFHEERFERVAAPRLRALEEE